MLDVNKKMMKRKQETPTSNEPPEKKQRTITTPISTRKDLMQRSVNTVFLLLSIVVPNIDSNDWFYDVLTSIARTVGYAAAPAAKALLVRCDGSIEKAQEIALSRRAYLCAQYTSIKILVPTTMCIRAMSLSIKEGRLDAFKWLYRESMHPGTWESRRIIFYIACKHGDIDIVREVFSIMYGEIAWDRHEMELLFETIILRGLIEASKFVFDRGCREVIDIERARMLVATCRERCYGDGVVFMKKVIKMAHTSDEATRSTPVRTD